MTPHLPHRPLGKTGLSVTPIGIGGAYLGVSRNNGTYEIDEDLGIAAIHRALELGINLIDTSAGYMGGGRSERIVGKAITQWLAAGGDRSSIVLETKTGTRDRQNRDAGAYTAKATWESIETSLRLLDTDYLDIALVHDPREIEPVLAPDGAWEALQDMKAQGLVKAIGLGTRSHEHHQRLMETGVCDVCLTHSDFNLLTQTAREGVLAPAALHGVGVLNGTSLAHGLLLGTRPPDEVVASWQGSWRERLKHQPEVPAMLARAQVLWDWARCRHISLLALNLQYIARESRVSATLMGASTPAQIEADVNAITAELPTDVWDELGQLLV